MSFVLLWLACGPASVDIPDDPTTSSEPTDPTATAAPDCVPLESAFETNARPVIEARCAECHGATPAYGAPHGLLDYAPLVEGDAGTRIVDRMVDVLVAGVMPPGSAAPLTHGELDTLVSWASCGAVHPDPGEGLQASRPVFAPPKDPPLGAEAVEITASEYFVSETTLDHYQEFAFDDLVDQDRFIQRIEPVIDEGAVVHHITVRQSTTGRYLYTWAPGTDAIHLPDGGLRLSPDDVLRIEVHYNNGAGLSDIYDSSGIRLWLVDEVDVEYGMIEPQTWSIAVPAGGTTTATARCTARSDFSLVAGMPHMHEIGSTFDTVLERPDGTRTTILELTGWSFEAQYFYDLDGEVQTDDVLEVSCGYDNPTDDWVFAGLGTGDEMCFHFLYVTPPDARLDCPLAF